MRKLLLPLLWALALVALPVYILLTGNAAAEVVLKYAVYGHASLALAYAVITGSDLLAATKLWGEDLGAKPHARLMKRFEHLKAMSTPRFMLTPAICFASNLVLTLIGLSTLAGIVMCVALLVILARVSVLHYGKKFDTAKACRAKTGVGCGFPAY